MLGELAEAVLPADDVPDTGLPERVASGIRTASDSASRLDPAGSITIDYPLDESIFPPEFLPPTFLWHDTADGADTWLVEVLPATGPDGALRVLVPGAPRPRGTIDRDVISDTNSLYEGTDYQNSAVSWTPSGPLWEEIKRRSVESPATITFTGFASRDLGAPLSRGTVRLSTSADPVGAPIFYRDVPLMASVGEHGKIQPLGPQAIPAIAWRLRDVSKPEPKLVLKGMPSCGNCHSFSADGKTLGMDVDGPDGDKGMYAIKPVEKLMVVGSDDVITWNSFPDKPEGHRTIGFMSRVSPDGRYVASTVNEALFVTNFKQYEFLQVFYPTRGILAVYDRETEEMHALPGADDPEYVHCSPAWSPDGSEIIFSRAPAFDPFTVDMPLPKRSMDPNEPKIRYDLCRIPFNGGKGGEAVPVEGASQNGMSNTFPKVSPDGEWIVYTKCSNGLLMRPDSRLWIVPFEGGDAREMRCNTPLMNSWHSFSPNGRWLVFSSKSRTPYTQAFLTHIDEDGVDSPAILVPDCTADNRAVNLPEFLNAPFEGLDTIEMPVVDHYAHSLIAERLMDEGNYAGAAGALKDALEVAPTFLRALNNLGYVYLKLGRLDEALLLLERAQAQEPRDLHVLDNLATAYLETGRSYLALRVLTRLVEIAPGFPETVERTTAARRQISELEEETRECRRAIDREPRNGELEWRLSFLYRRAGRLEESVDHLARAVQLMPGDPRPLASLSWILATNADERIRAGIRAVALAEQAVSLSGGDVPETLDILAVALAETGRFETAVAIAERALARAREVRPEAVERIEGHLDLLRKGRPVRESADR